MDTFSSTPSTMNNEQSAALDHSAQNELIECLSETATEQAARISPALFIDIKETRCANDSSTFFEIPEPIQALDNILSEFEEPDSLPPTVNNVLQESHSEDDGYMSLNGRRCDVNNAMGVIKESSKTAYLNLDNPPREADHEVRISEPLNSVAKNIVVSIQSPNHDTVSSIQNTLPKTRTSVCTKGNYSSLPCSSLRSNAVGNKIRVGSCSGERNILGIDISAVHNAVLRGGVAKLPEPIVNEHPVTIYPGRISPPGGGGGGGVGIGMNWNTRQPRVNANVNSSFALSEKALIALTKVKKSFKKEPWHTENHTDYFDEQKNRLPQHATSKEPDDFSENSSDEIQDSVYQQKNNIAWEINFYNRRINGAETADDDDNTKNKCQNRNNKSSDKMPSKNYNGNNVSSTISTDIFQCGIKQKESPLQQKDFLLANEPPHKYDLTTATATDDDDFNELAAIDGSMLGKGTFIIRKRNKDKYPLKFDTDDMEDEQFLLNLETTSNLNKVLKNSPRSRMSLNLDIDHLKPDMEVKLGQQQYRKTLEKEMSYEATAVETVQAPPKLEHNSCNHGSLGLKQSFELIASSSSSSSLFENSKNSYQCSIKSNCLRSPGSNEHISSCTTPHRELAPPLEEEEEQCSESQSGCAPLRQIEHNISALLRGDIAVARIGDASQSRRSLGYRPGVHKSESAKEMLLSQNAFGPLPPSPPSSSAELNECDDLPPLPPSPSGTDIDDNILDSECISATAEIHSPHPLRVNSNSRDNSNVSKYILNDLPLPPTPDEIVPPVVPPHRGSYHSQTIRSRSIDSNYMRKCPKAISHSGSSGIPVGYGTSSCDVTYTSKRAQGTYGLKRNFKQSPREEHRLQTSCSLPETPIFARGCDIARTPHRRQTEIAVGSGARTAPRSNASQTSNMGSSIIGISGGNTLGVGMCRQRTINHVLASGEILRLSGGPARGWYPKQRSMRPASTENIDRIHSTHPSSMRVWDSAGGMTGTGQVRKPLTLPPNLTPSFLNKSPREALRRVTSLLINKKGNSKERDVKVSKENMSLTATGSNHAGVGSISKQPHLESQAKQNQSSQKSQKKKGFFKQFWKKSKHYSLEQ